MKPNDSRIEEIEDLFEEADEDSDGQISLTEFRSLMRTLDRELRDDAVSANFRKIDANHDGRVGFDEFRAWWLRG